LSGDCHREDVSTAERQTAVNSYARTLQPPADKMQPTLPVGPE
jgi:hypothetical protein